MTGVFTILFKVDILLLGVTLVGSTFFPDIFFPDVFRDEPTNHLDVVNVAWLKSCLSSLRNARPVCVCVRF